MFPPVIHDSNHLLDVPIGNIRVMKLYPHQSADGRKQTKAALEIEDRF